MAKVTINGLEHEYDLTADLFINTGALNDDYTTHAERFAWYATAYELAEQELESWKAVKGLCYARKDAEFRAQQEALGKKVTEKSVEAYVMQDAEYQNVASKYLDVMRSVGMMKAARDAMMHRKDMLVGLGANYRAEGTSDVKLMEEAIESVISKSKTKYESLVGGVGEE